MLNLSFRQRVLNGFAVSIILVLVVGILSYRSISQLEDDSVAVDHTQKVIKTATNLLQLMIDAETGMRGYVATNNKAFLDPYTEALPNINHDVEQLRVLIADNPIQVKRIDSLSAFVNAQLNILKENIDTRPIKGLDFMVQNHMIINGKHNMDEIRAINDHLIETENHLLSVRKANSQESSTKALIIIITGSVIFLIIIIVLFFYIQGTFEQQKKTENEVKITNTRT